MALAAFVLPSVVHADDIATDEDVCRGKTDGTPCQYDQGRGVCTATTCPSLDYSSDPPKSIERPCSKCLPGGPPKPDAEAKSEAPKAPEAKAGPFAGCTIDPSASALGVLLGVVLLAVARRR